MQAPGCQISAAAYLLVLLTTSQVLATGKSHLFTYTVCTRQRTHLCYPDRHNSVYTLVSVRNNLILLTPQINDGRNPILTCSFQIKQDYRCQSFRGYIFPSVPIIILSSKTLNFNFSLIASFHLLALLSWIDFFIRSGTEWTGISFVKSLAIWNITLNLHRINYIKDCLFL